MELRFSKNKWDPKDYLKQYYSLNKLVYDEVLIFKYTYKFLTKFKKDSFADFLDFGSGPTVHRLLPFLDYAKKIYVADYLPENLKEIKLWLKNKPGAHNWDGQFKHILKIERSNQKKPLINLDSEIEGRKIKLKKKIKAIIRCDAFKKKSLPGFKKKFDLVTSFYCIDSITDSKTKWKSATKNLLNLVKPGGWIIISALRNTKYYMVEQSKFPSANIDEGDFLEVFAQSSFDLKTVDVKIISAKLWMHEGIKSLMIISAQKSTNQ